jgi:hypothetical protein
VRHLGVSCRRRVNRAVLEDGREHEICHPTAMQVHEPLAAHLQPQRLSPDSQGGERLDAAEEVLRALEDTSILLHQRHLPLEVRPD